MDEWKILEENLKKLPLTKEDARAFTRFFFSGAVECEVDKQGRINIPQPLRNYAVLEKECAVIGVSNRVEFWASESWEDYFTDSEESFAEIAENLLDFDKIGRASCRGRGWRAVRVVSLKVAARRLFG